jgi:hypothetical protein
LLKELSTNKHWPKDLDCTTSGKGKPATDVPEQFMQFLNFANYAPVICHNDRDEFEIDPIQDFPEDEMCLWQELIGLDPTTPSSNYSS